MATSGKSVRKSKVDKLGGKDVVIRSLVSESPPADRGGAYGCILKSRRTSGRQSVP